MQTETWLDSGPALERARFPAPLGILLVLAVMDVISTTLSVSVA